MRQAFAATALLLITRRCSAGCSASAFSKAWQPAAAVATVGRRSTPYSRDGVAFIAEFLPAADFTKVRDDCRSLRGGMKLEKDSIAIGRMGRYVDSRSAAHKLLTSSPVVERVSRLVGGEVEPSEYPIELRSYRAGSGMDWHQDDQLYEDAQCELVLCLDNDSDSRTEWIDAKGDQHSEWTPPNSALLVRAGDTGAAHRVIPLKTGERTILKMVWTVPGSAKLDSFYEHIDSLPGLRGKGLKQASAGGNRKGAKGRRQK